MPRPKTKAELQQLSDANFTKLLTYIDQLEDKNIEFPPHTLNRNVKDVLFHLYEWHQMMMSWYKVGMSGSKPIMPKEGFTWKTLPDLNKRIREQYKDGDLDTALQKVKHSHQDIRTIIDQHSEEELFTKKKYKWTGTTSLAAYLISCTSSHYDWAYKLIRKSTK